MRLHFWGLRTNNINVMNETIEINIAHPKSHLNEIRQAYAVPDKYSDELLLQTIISIIIDDYMNVENIEAEILQGALTNGNIADRWLNKDNATLSCEYCKRGATMNFQKMWISWKVDKNLNHSETPELEFEIEEPCGDENIYVCDEHAEEYRRNGIIR